MLEYVTPFQMNRNHVDRFSLVQLLESISVSTRRKMKIFKRNSHLFQGSANKRKNKDLFFLIKNLGNCSNSDFFS